MTALMRKQAGYTRGSRFRFTEVVCDAPWTGVDWTTGCKNSVSGYDAAAARSDARAQGWRCSVADEREAVRTRRDFCPEHIPNRKATS